MPTVEETNRELADKVVAEAMQNPHAYAGKYIGIANGKLVIASNDLDEVDDELDAVEPDSAKTLIVDLTHDVNKIEYVWAASTESRGFDS